MEELKTEIIELKEQVNQLKASLETANKVIAALAIIAKCEHCESRCDGTGEICEFCDDKPFLCEECMDDHILQCKYCDHTHCVDTDLDYSPDDPGNCFTHRFCSSYSHYDSS